MDNKNDIQENVNAQNAPKNNNTPTVGETFNNAINVAKTTSTAVKDVAKAASGVVKTASGVAKTAGGIAQTASFIFSNF